MSDWRLIYDGFDPDDEGLREALCTLGNGYIATRGAAPESSADGVHYPATYAAGVFNRLSDDVDGHVVTNESIVNLPNWLPLAVRGPGGWFDDREAEVVSHHVELDPQRAVLVRRTTFADGDGRRLCVAQRRIVSLRDPHLAALETTIVSENWDGPVTVRSAIDGGVRNAGVPRYADARRSAPRRARGPQRVPRGDVAAGRDGPVPGADRGGDTHTGVRRRRPAGRGTGGPRRQRAGRPRLRPAPHLGCAGHDREGRRRLHLPGPGDQRAGGAGPGVGDGDRRRLRASCTPATRSPGVRPGGSGPSSSGSTTTSRATSTSTCSTCSRPCPTTRSASMWASRRGACTARRTAGTSSGTSCSSSRSSAPASPSSPGRCCSTATAASTRPAVRRPRPASPAPCTRGRAPARDERRPSNCTSTPPRAGGSRTRRACSATSAQPSR